MEDVVRRDMSQILGIGGWRRRAKDREKWRRLLRDGRAGWGCSAKNGTGSYKIKVKQSRYRPEVP